MKKINTLTMMILLTFSFSIAQELEVQGDLDVTGTIESATIDSIQAEIDSLKADMASMHADNQLETRVYELPRIEFTDGYYYNLDIPSITGYELDYGILKLIHVDDFFVDNDYCEVSIKSTYTYYTGSEEYTFSEIKLHNGGGINYQGNDKTSIVFHNGQIYKLHFQISNGWVDLVLAITAQFPD